MNVKVFTAGTLAALGLAMSAAPAQAYLLGYAGSAGAQLDLNGGGGVPNGFTTLSDFDPTTNEAMVGWYSSTGFHDPTNETYTVARLGDPAFGGLGYNDFFTFDLTGFTGVVTSAQLWIYNSNFTDPDYLRLGSYSGSIAALKAGTGGVGAYNALGSGVLYANPYLSTPGWQIIDLNSAFIDYANATLRDQGNTVVLGGTIRAPGELPGGVPEPATWAMMIMGFMGIGAVIRRRRRSIAAA